MAGRSTAGVLVAALLLWGPAPATAQGILDFEESSNWFVGYVVNAPHQLLGFGTMATFQELGGFGIYVDAKFSIDSPARDRAFIGGMTPEDVEQEPNVIFFRDDSAWTAVNVALVKGLSEELALYAGAGYSQRREYTEYLDENQELGEFGRFWIRDSARDETHTNFIGGAFFRVSNRIVFQFGVEAAPAGFTAGMHIRLR